VAAIIALMIASGRTLEEYGASQAKNSLTKLIDRIPNTVSIWKNGEVIGKEAISKVKIGQEILIRRGEVIGLDGVLISQTGLTDESSLTGEPYAIDKLQGDTIRSGTINIGNPIVLKATKEASDSTYRKIIDMVKRAQGEKAPLVRLADRYSVFFTFLTLGIAGFAYFYSGDVNSVLAVLVIATPCPLILATPIALMGGINAAAKKRIIIKKLSNIEVLSRIKAVIFDKTGTITLGKPKVVSFKILNKNYEEKKLLAISEALERNSLHPLAKTIVNFAKEKKSPIFHAEKVKEIIGSGIEGLINGKKYSLTKLKEEGMAIGIYEGSALLAIFRFEDEIKKESKTILSFLKNLGLELFIFTGDKKASAEKIAKEIGGNITVQAECSPEDKKNGIEALKKEGKTTAMIGDGINDAPALAFADVGMVFANDEQTAASEAADIVFLGGDFSLVLESFKIAKKTIGIALESIRWGIGLSIVGMIFASFGLIPPIVGAFLQEAIDVAVILNALRASR
ncbi:MAG: heavy metal translocating P-type ATPase, partial [Candidatus Levybacteria bacterium]|nr:heavy metal translocating P-type ATPase [Candidatus Levybacteria bacterium]